MDYSQFCEYLTKELPLNRKERFYTGTVLPALLFHEGLSNFFTFLREIEDFPPEINETQTGDNFLFYTEYNLQESAGARGFGISISAETKDTPDVIVEILTPVRVMVVIEAKVFARPSQEQLTQQIKRQKELIGTALGKLNVKRVYHLALVPRDLALNSTDEYQVLNWEFFVDDSRIRVRDNYFYNYLKFALDHYSELASAKGGRASTVEETVNGWELYELAKEKAQDLWIGRQGGAKTITQDVRSGKWENQKYNINSIKPSKGHKGNWIHIRDFKRIVDDLENKSDGL